MIGFLAVLMTALILVFISAFGIIVKKTVLSVIKSDKSVNDSIFSTPIIGLIALICITQTLNILLPTRAIAILLTPVAVIGIIWYRKDIADFFIKLKRFPAISSIVFITLVLTLLPCIRYNDLLIPHFANNDAAFYLSSMEWLRDYTYLDPIGFTSTEPYYSLANYMLRTTRIGMDLFGALVLSFIPLQSHQVFMILCAIFNVILVFSAVHLAKETFGIKYWLTCLCAAFIGFGASIVELTKQHYLPQILGIAFFVYFIACIIRFFTQKRSLWTIIELSLAAIATISVYSEYASYAVILFLFAFIIKTILAKDFIKDVIDSFKMLVLAFISNIPGFVIALRFNINILFSQLGSLNNIDPYNGNITDIGTFLRYILNIDFNAIRAMSNSNTLYRYIFYFLVFFMCIIGVIIVLHAVRGAVISIKRFETLFAISTLVFFFAYLMFFRATSYAYGEYKHIHLTMIPSLILLLYLVFISLNTKFKINENTSKAKIILAKYTVTVSKKIIAVVFVVFSIVNSFAFSSISKSNYRFDHSLDELSEAVKTYVPVTETVGIMNGYYFDAHSIVYALRDSERSVSILTPDSYYISHLPSKPVRPVNPTYIVTPVTDADAYGDILNLEDYTLLWKNSRHCILKNNTPVGVFIDYGFSGLDVSNPHKPTRTANNNAAIVVWNTSNTSISVNIDFATHAATDGLTSTFEIYLEDVLIFSGTSGDIAQIVDVTIPASSSVSLRINAENPIKITSLDTDIIS
ncbi:MAG: hypothetical protein IKB51_00535 [Clostridia bacterium]|nr:hypothetical protein [Clostridia bacterium]